MPEHLSRPEIEQWRDETIARLRQEGNARLDKIREHYLSLIQQVQQQADVRLK